MDNGTRSDYRTQNDELISLARLAGVVLGGTSERTGVLSLDGVDVQMAAAGEQLNIVHTGNDGNFVSRPGQLDADGVDDGTVERDGSGY